MRLRLLTALLGVMLLANTIYAGEDAALKDQRDKVSYSIGMSIGKDFKNQSLDVDPDILARGIKDVFSGGKPLMTDEEVRETMTNFRNEMMVKQTAHMKEMSDKNKKEGEAFLAENKKKEGVVTLPSGLQYKIITEGTGEKPKAADTVTVNYRGTLIDGTEFDSSYSRNQPATFKVTGVIPGWTEALQLMKAGSKWQLFIPSNLAYGERGAGRDIGPNSTLIFEVELLSIKETAAKEAPAPAEKKGEGKK
ncbi:MAG: FKBP-type peptidyl-prolyl cis-trans isomerase [Nitrospirae bacterium]|nr:FKBP-type peptidyl-prolyl cis-trans isomerase [Nitrospirota bacterium]